MGKRASPEGYGGKKETRKIDFPAFGEI